MRASLKGRRALGKLVALTLLVIVITIQTVVHHREHGSRVRDPTTTTHLLRCRQGFRAVLLTLSLGMLASAYRHMLSEDLGQTGSGSLRIKGIRKGLWNTMTMLTIESFGSIIKSSIAEHLQHVHHLVNSGG